MGKYKFTTSGPLKLTKGYKFWVDEEITLYTDIKIPIPYTGQFVEIWPTYGKLSKRTRNVIGSLMVIKKGFAFDGKSGGIQTTKTKIPAAFHDHAYRLIRLGILPQTYRIVFDDLFRDLCKQQGGFTKFMADIWFWALRRFGKSSADKPRKVYTYYLKQ